MSDEFKFERFGRYLILDHLVDGGMAKICRARFLGEQAAKIVAIKMVQEQFSKDPGFKQMFMDELKVGFALIHPNIAQTYDYGMVNGQLYTAMEYVDGANLKQYLDRLKAHNYVFPVEISVYITSQICQGLHYAHTFTDKLSGDKYNIIHRDISPHNIMLTYDGAVKVIDFGIAKADTNAEATQAGTIKGKLSYLAPEYLEGEELDHRYDQFAVGITLWELLCSRKLFTAANDLAVLKQIQACKIPAPSSINPNVPKELDEIVLKALSKDRKNRYEDMDKFNRALVKFLYANYPDFNATDLKYFAEQLFKSEIKKDRAKLAEYGKVDVDKFLEELKKEAKSGTAGASSSEASVGGNVENFSAKAIELELDMTPDLEDSTRSISLEAEAGLSTADEVGEKTSTSVRREQLARKEAQRVSKAGKTRVIKLNQKKLAEDRKKNNTDSGPFKKVVGLVGVICAFAYMKPAMFQEFTGVNIAAIIGGTQANRSVSSVEGQPVVEMGKVLLSGLDPLADLYVDGKPFTYSLAGIDVPMNKKVQLKIQMDGMTPFITSITVDSASGGVKKITIPKMEAQKVGLLTTSLNYRDGAILKLNIGGEKIEKKLPIKNMRIPSGMYDAAIVDPELGTEKKIQFTIEENKRLFLD